MSSGRGGRRRQCNHRRTTTPGAASLYTNFVSPSLVTMAGFVTSSAIRTRQENELNQVRRIAAVAQDILLTPMTADWTRQAASMYLAAETGRQIGGDLYGAIPTIPTSRWARGHPPPPCCATARFEP
ncbi:hypothetical protein ACGFX2_37265 [Streptomyces goshikiensis]|uniref:hypothetical protein n=1 Tax=Streptomyces goshikiensis TaxID=1942 RepID=UPI0037120F15